MNEIKIITKFFVLFRRLIKRDPSLHSTNIFPTVTEQFEYEN